MGFKDTFYTVRINVIRNKFINNTGVEQGGVFYNNQNMNKTIEIYWDGMYEEKKDGEDYLLWDGENEYTDNQSFSGNLAKVVNHDKFKIIL